MPVPKHPWWRKPIDVIAMTAPGATVLRATAHHLDRPLLALTRGRVGLTVGLPTLRLTTTGARTGQQRTLPLLYVEQGDDLAIIGTRFGSTRHPGWYYNLKAKPEAVVQIKGERFEVDARLATPEERAEIWPKAVRIYPGYDNYLSRVGDREVPIFVLSRRTGGE